ncbi:MAG TPA: hypothetical protein VHE83_13790 [Mycobacteriales bacterium]|nr:hypothetical protein [Mycobacteriales bacterium]
MTHLRRNLAGLGVAAFLATLGAVFLLWNTPARAIPIPPVTYSIIGSSGNHQISLLNLPIGQVGTYQAPIPVDVDGDLLPDVQVSVNLVNVNGVFNNPPQVGAIVAPNIQIDRLVTTSVLGQPSPPLKIQVKLTVADSSGGPGTTLTFGYDTSQGGSIPTYFHTIVGGLTSFFNPLQAVVDTTGTVVGLKPNINGLGLAPVAAPYQGPLHVIGDINAGGTDANLDLGFRPFPSTVNVSYGTDSSGQHITYGHSYTGQVELNAGIKLASSTSTTTVNARVDRLPKSLAMDLNSGGQNSGTVDLRASQNGRLPDVGLNVATTAAGQRPLNANVSIDALPSVLHGEWSLPTGGPAKAAFCAPAAPSATPCTAPQGAGVGVIQARVTNYAANAAPFTPYVPDQQQFLSFQQGGHDPTDPDMLINARVERVRHLDFTQTPTGLDAHAQLGDGALPLLAHFVTDGRGGTAPGPYTEATATVTPLPSSAHLSFQLPTTTTTSGPPPMSLTYEASDPVDITGAFKTYPEKSGGACGTAKTVCASLKAFHIPSTITTTITASNGQSRINVDSSTPGATALVKPDFIADATLGQDDTAHPIVAHAQLLGLPTAVTILTHQGADETLDTAEFHACDWDTSTNACAAGQTVGSIGDLSFNARNWLTRPTGLAAPNPTTPLYADVESVGTPDPHVVLFEAAARVTDISEVDYRNTGGVAGVRVHAGGAKAFSTHLDAGNIDIKPDDATTHRVTAIADASIPKLPSTLDLCFRQPNNDIAVTGADYTTSCEDKNPFGDGNLTKTPLTFSYRANDLFTIHTSAKIIDEGPDSATDGSDTSPADDRTYKGSVDLTDLPKNATINLQMPPSGTEGPVRAIYCSGSVLSAGSTCPTAAASDPQVNIDVSGAVTDASLGCEDPRTGPTGPQHDQLAICFRGRLANLPSHAVLDYDPTIAKNNFTLITSGDKAMSITGFGGNATTPDCSNMDVAPAPNCFELSAVQGTATPLHPTAKPDYLVFDGNITDLPKSIVGTLDAPNTVDFSTTDNPIGDITVTARNFLAPDPTQIALPPQRTDNLGNPLPNPGEQFTFFQRGDAFKATGHVSHLTRVGYTTATDPNGTPLDTKVVHLGFGQNDTIRVYADIDNEGSTPAPDQPQHITGDVTLTNFPTALALCFRGAVTQPGTPNTGTFCDAKASDGGPTPEQGAFQVMSDGTPPAGLGVHAFFRDQNESDGTVLSGAADVTGIPRVLQGTFSGGQAQIAGFANIDGNGIGTTPKGIDSISAELANSDLSTTGYGNNPPWSGNVPSPLAAFPAPPAGNGQFVYLADDSRNANAPAFHVQATVHNLQGVTFSDQPCAKPASDASIGYTAPPDYPFLPTPGNPAPNTPSDNPDPSYTCIRADFTSKTNDPLALSADISTPTNHIAVTNAGLSYIPDFFQANLATAQATDTDTSQLRPTCGPASAAHADDCVPAMMRIDTGYPTPGPAPKLFGVVELGSPADTAKLDNTRAGDTNLADSLEATPTATTWSAGENTDGVRVKVGTGGKDPAVRAALRLSIPKDITVDQFASWSCTGPGPVKSQFPVPGSGAHPDLGCPDTSAIGIKADQYWSASDLTFHYTLRGTDDKPASPGDLTAMIADLGTGGQTLVSGDNIDPGSTVPADAGVPIPGELGLGVYLRDFPGVGQKFIQLEGRTSQSISAKAQILPAAGTDGTPITATVQNIPAVDGSTPANGPSFRLRVQMEGDPTPPPAPPSDGGSSIGDALLCIVYCVNTDVHVQSVAANFNFHPPASTTGPAHEVMAVVNQLSSTKNNVEVRGFSDVDAGAGQTPDAKISGGAHVIIDPLDISLHVGIPVVGSFDFIMDSNVTAGADIGSKDGFDGTSTPGTADFVLRQNLLKLQLSSHTASDGPGDHSPSQIDAQINLEQFHALLFSIFGFLPFFGGNPVLLGIDFIPPSPPSVLLTYPDCTSAGFGNRGTVLNADDGDSADVIAWPLDDPRFVFYGTLGPAIDVLARFFGPPIFCAFDPDGSPIIDSTHPGNPIPDATTTGFTDTQIDSDYGSYELTFHHVPGFGANPPIAGANPVPPAPPAPPKIIVDNGDTLSLCGAHAFTSVEVKAGGVLKVADSPSATKVPGTDQAECPPDPSDPSQPVNVGALTLTAQDYVNQQNASSGTKDCLTAADKTGCIVVDAGGIVQAMGTSGPVNLTGQNVAVAGAVLAGSGKLSLTATDPQGVVDVDGPGVVNANATNADAPPLPAVPATGNGGGGHGGAGGTGRVDAGTTGSGGTAFGSTAFKPPSGNDSDGVMVTEPGGPGHSASSAVAGLGGGTIAFIGQTVQVDGLVTANGGGGQAGDPGTAGDCSGSDYVAAAGGGAGGGITVTAVTFTGSGTVRANGGPGGSGGGGAGGGGGGIVKVVAPLDSVTPHVSAGAQGVSTAACSFTDSTTTHSGKTPTDNDPASRASLPAGQFWFRGTDVNVPVSAAAATTSGGNDSFTVYLCGEHESPNAGLPTIQDPMTHKYGPPQNLGFVMPTNSDRANGSICGNGPLNGLVPIDSTSNPSEQLTPQVLAHHTFTHRNQTAYPFSMAPDDTLATGYWAVWTEVVQAPTSSTSCYDTFGAWNGSCTLEDLPSQPQAVFGVDNDKPQTPTITVSPTTPTNNNNVTIDIDNVRDIEGQYHDPATDSTKDVVFSGVQSVQCSNDGTTYVACGSNDRGVRQWTVPNVPGLHPIWVKVTDNAGNSSTAKSDPVVLALDSPGVSAAPDSPADRKNGWYSQSPTFTLTYKALGPLTGIPGKLSYHFDSGDPKSCPLPPPVFTFPLSLQTDFTCQITTGLPLHGVHTLYFQATDLAGNVSAVGHLAVRIDDVAPTSVLLSVPSAPDGAHGWYVGDPSFVVSAADEAGGSGLTPPSGGSLGSGVYWSVDGGALQGTGQSSTPFPLGNGTHTVCWYAEDFAGNQDVGAFGTQPTNAQLATANHCQTVKVDDVVPSVAVNPTPALPNGQNGWYTSTVPVAVVSTTGPSGVDTTYVSIDHASWVPYTPGITIPEGTHDVRSYVVNNAGVASAVVDLPVNVDLSPPLATAVLVPGAPAQNGWYRSTPFPGNPADSPPQVVLRAVDGDQNAGVVRLQYTLDTAPTIWVDYTVPFAVPEGVHVVTYRAIDAAGLIERTQTLPVNVDVTPPVVTAASANPSIWLALLNPLLGNVLGLSPAQSQLGWTVKDNLSPHVHITVLVFNVAGAVVRQIDGGTYNVTPGTTLTGSTAWDGHDQTVTGLVPVGVYYYRVIATDDGGTAAQSGESRPIQITAHL